MVRRGIRQMRIVHVRSLSGTTKFGMLRSILGPMKADSNACEASARSEKTDAVDTKNGDQEV